jgi:50S ribosomal protein L16 3-hydroxylase
MDLDAPTPLLGGLSPARFMRRHWQKQPLLVRQAWAGVMPPLARAALFELASREAVESRLVAREGGGRWRLRHGPLPRRALPPVGRPGWTLLVQGLDLHVPAAHAMLRRFDFIPHARLDDLMVSWASDGGGVGPHLDSYDVFLIQVQGRRRWRIGRVADTRWVEGVPLRILRHFEPEQEWVLEPGDMLYLPPQWGHDGIAEGECMTASVGFRAPARDELARELLLRLADELEDEVPRLYADPRQAAVADPGRVPPALTAFAAQALARALAPADALPRALGEILTEPKPQVWFEPAAVRRATGGVQLDPRTRMLYDERHVFVNGESWRAAGRDARLLRSLADRRELGAKDRSRLSADAQAVLDEWLAAGWLQELA